MIKFNFGRATVIRFICFLGFSIQIYCLTIEFIQFKVRNNIAYEYPLTNELPDIDIVIPMAMAINLTALFERRADQMKYMCVGINGNVSKTTNLDNFEETCGKKLREIPIFGSYLLQNYIKLGDIKELALENPADKISIWWNPTESLIMSNIGVEVNRSLCSTSRWITSYAVFMRISCLNQTKHLQVGINQVMNKYGGAKTQAMLHHRYDSVFGIRFSSSSSLPETDFSQYSLFDNTGLEKVSTASVRYSKTISTSLQFPYETLCSDKQKTEVLNNCLLDHTLKEAIPYIYPNILLAWNHGLSGEIGFSPDKMYAKDGFLAVRERQENTEKYCTKKLPTVECHKISYTTRLEKHPGHNPLVSYIMYEPPIDPTMYYTTKPALPLTEYLIFAGSIAGVWFGFSIFEQLINSFGYGKCLTTNDQYSSNQTICPKQINTVHQAPQNGSAKTDLKITDLCKRMNYF